MKAIDPSQASLERLVRQGVMLVAYPALSVDQGRTMLEALVREWGQPHLHSARGELVWDVRSQPDGAARSQGDAEFQLHTDASFEEPPPRFVGLLVVQADEQGGGLSQWVSSAEVLARLTPDCRLGLRKPGRIKIPAEFSKGKNELMAPLLAGRDCLRYRSELLEHPCSQLDQALLGPVRCQSLQTGQLLLLDNWRMLHGRSQVLDPRRHLLRVRFWGPQGPTPFGRDGHDPWFHGLDLFQCQQFWEAHEAWEELWQVSDKRSPEGLALRGLIQAAAAGLKSLQGQERGVEILRRRAEQTLASSGLEEFREVDLGVLRVNLSRLRCGQVLELGTTV